MRLPFRQGIVRYQTNNVFPNPTPLFLQSNNGGSVVDLIANPDPTIITFAHGPDHDYVFEERLSIASAWTGFTLGVDYWLYWDIDNQTAQRTFGYTTVAPVVGNTPPSTPSEGLHWFDLINQVMKVYTNGVFVERIRVFAARYHGGGAFTFIPLGSQVGLNTSCQAGSILFDENGDPIRQGRNRHVTRFITSETNFLTHATSSSNLKLETEIQMAEAVTNIASYQLISYAQYNQITFASSSNIERDIIGLTREPMFIGEVGSYIAKGHVVNPNWDWNQAVGTSLYSDETGQLVTTIPQSGSIQKVGIITSPTSILLDIQPRIIIEEDI